MNRYASYCLKCEDGYCTVKNSMKFNFSGKDEYTFSLDYFYTGNDGIVFRQGEGSVLKVEGGSLFWISSNVKVWASCEVSKLVELSWNHIDVVQSKGKVELFVNGVPISEFEGEKTEIKSYEDFCLLEDEEGYLRNVRLVDYGFSADEVISNIVVTKAAKEHLIMSLGFDSMYCEDKGKYRLELCYGGFSRCENIIQALSFQGEGYALIDEVDVNPGDKEALDFTIALRIFVNAYDNKVAKIFENKGSTDDFGICLCEEQSSFVISLSGQEFAIDNYNVPFYQWVSVVVSYFGGKLLFFADGKKYKEFDVLYERLSYPKFVLGEGFVGSIDYFAVYDKGFKEDEANGVFMVEPYFFDDGIKSLFMFHGEGALLGNGNVLLGEGVSYSVLEGTVYDNVIENFTYRSNDKFLGNEFEKWEADFLSDVAYNYSAVLSGADNVSISNCEKEFLLKNVISMPAAQALLISYAGFETTEIVKYMKGVSLVKAVPEMLFGTIAKEAVSASYAVMMKKVMEYQFTLGLAAGLLVAAEVATKAKSKTKEPELPPYVPYDPDQKFGYSVELLSCQFCNETRGSLCLREDYDRVQSLPEWTGGMSQGVCAYVRKAQSPVVKVRFKYVPAKDQPPVQVSIGLKGKYLGSGKSKPVLCGTLGEYETELVLDKGKFPSMKVGKSYDELSCFYTGKLGDTFCGGFGMDVHILADEPILPWKAYESKEAPIIPLLNMVDEAGDITDGVSFLNCVCGFISSRESYKIEKESVYSNCNLDVGEFCFEKFCRNFILGNISGSDLDYSMFVLELGRMEGFNISLYEISSYEDTEIVNKKINVLSYGINLNNVKAFGNEFSHIIGRKYALSINDKYWDAVFTSSYDKSFLNMTYEEYIKNLIDIGSIILDPLEIKLIVRTDKTEPKIIKISYDPNEGFVSGRRPEFSKYIKDHHYYPENMACCHIISYKTIEAILIDTFNLFINEGIDQDIKNLVLESLVNCFYPEGEGDGTEADNKNFAGLLNNYNVLFNWRTENNKIIVSFNSTSMLCHLNNAPHNLKDGFANWNSSISTGFDPVNWEVYATNGQNHIKLSDKDNVYMSYSSLNSGGYNEIHIYLNDYYDGLRIQYLDNIGRLLGKDYINIKIGYCKTGVFTSCPIVYSSNNQFDFRDVCSVSYRAKIFYSNNGNWEMLGE